MNEQGLDLLVTAYLESMFGGTPRQLRGLRQSAADGNGGFCTLGLFLHSVGCSHLTVPNAIYDNDPQMIEDHQQCQLRVAQRYSITREEWLQLREWDDHHDWLSIAMLANQKPANTEQDSDEDEEGEPA